MPLRRLGETQEQKIHRLTILVEVLMVYIIVVTGIGAWYMYGLIESNQNKAENVGQGLAAIACNAGLARENSIVDKGLNEKDQVSNLKAAQGYFGIMPALSISFPDKPLDRYGEKCPYPRLTVAAKKVVKDSK